MIIYCDKCKSANTEIISTDPKPKEKELTMSEFIEKGDGPTATHAVMIYRHYKIHCNNCDYELEYTEPRSVTLSSPGTFKATIARGQTY